MKTPFLAVFILWYNTVTLDRCKLALLFTATTYRAPLVMNAVAVYKRYNAYVSENVM